MLDLSQADLKIVLDILKKYANHMTVYAYGSRVTGKSHPGSDLDLVIMNHATKIPLAEIREAFRESNLPIMVDIFNWEEIPDSFKKEIDNHKVKIFG